VQQQHPLRVGGHLLGIELALVHHPLDDGVVVGDLEQLVVAQQVGAAVADVHQAELRTRPQQRGQRGAAVRLGVGRHQVAHRGAGPASGLGHHVQQVAGGHGGVERAQRVDRGLAGRGTRGAGAVPVGDGEHALAGVGPVLVRLADQAAIGAYGEADGER
jgi:hypothetical protein